MHIRSYSSDPVDCIILVIRAIWLHARYIQATCRQQTIARRRDATHSAFTSKFIQSGFFLSFRDSDVTGIVRDERERIQIMLHVHRVPNSRGANNTLSILCIRNYLDSMTFRVAASNSEITYIFVGY